MHTVLNISGLLQPLEDAVRQRFLLALIGRMSFSDKDRELNQVLATSVQYFCKAVRTPGVP